LTSTVIGVPIFRGAALVWKRGTGSRLTGRTGRTRGIAAHAWNFHAAEPSCPPFPLPATTQFNPPGRSRCPFPQIPWDSYLPAPATVGRALPRRTARGTIAVSKIGTVPILPVPILRHRRKRNQMDTQKRLIPKQSLRGIRVHPCFYLFLCGLCVSASLREVLCSGRAAGYVPTGRRGKIYLAAAGPPWHIKPLGGIRSRPTRARHAVPLRGRIARFLRCTAGVISSLGRRCRA